MLGEAYCFVQILEWARQALSLKREEKYLTLASIDIRQQGSTLPEGPLWVSYPNMPGVVKQAIARLGTAFRKAIDIHLSQHGLDIKEPYREDPTEYIQYRKLMMQNLHLQYETLGKPIDFPQTLCRLGLEESGFVAWQSAIRSFFEGIATEVEKTDMSAHIYGQAHGQAQLRMQALVIRNEASHYTLPWWDCDFVREWEWLEMRYGITSDD